MPVTYVRKAVTDPILMVADKMAPKLRQAYLDAVAAAASSVSLAALAEAIERGDSSSVITMLGSSFAGALEGKGLAADITSLRDAIQATYAAGAKAATGELPVSMSTELSFNLLNPNAVKALDSAVAEMVQDATVETKAAVQAIISRGFQAGESAAEMASDIRDVIGLSAQQERALASYRASLEAGDSTGLRDALSRAMRDGRYDRSLLSALDNQTGLGAKQIEKLVDRYQQRMRTYRANSVARTASVRASNAGQRETWRQAKEQGLIGDDAEREWEASGDDRTCNKCDGLDGQTAGIDEEFAPGIMQPPDPHDFCRCTTKLKFGRARARQAA